LGAENAPLDLLVGKYPGIGGGGGAGGAIPMPAIMALFASLDREIFPIGILSSCNPVIT
jgi:hypothetical protein